MRFVGLLALCLGLAPAQAQNKEPSWKFFSDGLAVQAKGIPRGKNKLCCGYPLVSPLTWALRFYWVADEQAFDHESGTVDVYTRDGFFLGALTEGFSRSLLMEGTGRLNDGRVVNYAGRCSYGTGTCYETMGTSHPFGRGAGSRSLVPFVSVAVDPRLVAIGDTLYIPEFDGVEMPDGSVHDGCVRADDTGGNIKHRKLDFFVATRENWKWIASRLWDTTWITPRVEEPRCAYLLNSSDY